jgi:coenzyme F420 hydrogenase subunit beta
MIMSLGNLSDFKGKTYRDLISDIINRELCTACGTCAGVCPHGLIKMSGEEPTITADASEKCDACGFCYACCPGERVGMDELELKMFGRVKDYATKLLGQYRGRKVAFATDPDIRLGGASGGTAAALQIYALEDGIVDAWIGVGFDKEKPWVPTPVISRTRQEILNSQGSKYTHCSVTDMLKEAAKEKLRVGFVGLACHIHGLRKIQALIPNSKLTKQVVCTIGLFCAENRFTFGVEHIITRRLGLPLDQVVKISYREGAYPGAFAVWDKAGNVHKIPYPDQLTFIWMHTRPRCRVCYDYTAELADISLGETQHLDKKLAHNAALFRTDIGQKLFEDTVRAGLIEVHDVDEDMIVNHTGLERKKYANALRMEWRRKHNIPTPDYPKDIDYAHLKYFYFGPKR